MIENYVPYHVHTYFSNCLINIDSVTRPEQYVAKAQEYGIKALSFSEHGNIFNWLGKKQSIEAAGMKYIHSAEVYVTRSIAPNESGEPTKIRDNYHCVLIARNFDGFQELNRLTSAAFNRDDGHFYYVPRITFDELKNTSDNILVTTACLGGILAKAEPDFRDDVLKFLKQNKRRCFLEVQHHRDFDQIELNKAIAELSRQYNIPMIAGTDTHALDDFAVECRAVMQRSKGVHFDGEDNFDLTFKSLDQLIYAYKKQNALSETEYLAAIDNTNKMADMVQPFTVDTTPKLPHISSDPDTEFDAAIAADLKEHPQLFEKHSEQEIYDRIATEKEVFQKTNSVEYMLLYRSIVKWCNGQDIFAGPGRGSAAGSLVSYIFGITEVDPLEYNLNFWRFMNPDRVSLCDIDRDYMSYDRDKLMEYLLRDHMGRDTIQTCKIITYNTLGLRGAIKDVGRALGMTPQQTDEISKQEVDGDVPPELRQQYPELFKYADGVLGTITAIGQHAAGVVITNNDNDLASNIGLSTNPAIPYPVSCIDMKQIDYCNYPKYDLLGLDYVGLINETCKRAGIPRLRPDTVNLDDDDVWNSIAKDTTLIFQFAEKYAQKYVQQILSPESMQESAKYDDHISRFNRLALASAMLRPGAASVRDEAAMGIYQEYDIPELNELLKPSMGTLVLQESLMEFLVKFCGYKPSESDYVRKCVHEDSLITMADGSLKPIKDIEVGDRVLSYDDAYVTTQAVSNVFDNGVQPVVQLSLQNTPPLQCTADHKVLTARGWVMVKDLTTNDYVMTPKRYVCETDGLRPNQHLSCLDMFMIGLLIGDGYIYKDCLNFINSEQVLIDKYKQCVNEHLRNAEPCVFIDNKQAGKTVEFVDAVSISSKNYRESVRKMLKDRNMLQLSGDKHISNDLMAYPADEKLAHLLAGLMNTDGYINSRGKRLEYSSKSQVLVMQMQALFLKFGIVSNYQTKNVKGYGYQSHCLLIKYLDSLNQFKRYILPYIVGRKHDEFEQVIQRANNAAVRGWNMPQQCFDEIIRAVKQSSQSVQAIGKAAGKGMGYQLSSDGLGISSEKAKIFVDALYCPLTYKMLTADYIPRRVVSVTPQALAHVYDIEVENTHNYIANGQICHNCVSKKRGTDQLIPEIKSRFLEYTPAHYNVTLETAEKIIDPFLQTVLDSASYSFSWNHSVPYTMISYMSGWLRTHYPLEFLATAIDIFRDKPDHIESIMNYITIHGIKLTPARFGIARSYSTVDHDSNSICQSIAPVKNVSVKTAEALYEISQSFDSPYFIDLLERTVGTGINKSMLESLIYISFFDRFGNQPELIRIMDMWQKWKDKKTFKPESIAEFNTPDVVAFATNLNSKGKPLKTYTITDRAAFLHALEDGVKAANMPDYSYKFKFENELALLNRVESCTHSPADRFKLFISSMRPLKRKSDGGVWGYSVGAISIGSGRSTDLTIGESLFALHPITKGSVIHVARPDLNLRKSKSGYWTLYSYSVLEG